MCVCMYVCTYACVYVCSVYVCMHIRMCVCTVCPTRYRTRPAGGPLFRVATVRRTTDTFLFISHTTNVLLFKFRCNIFIGVRIIKEMPGSVASGTHCMSLYKRIDWLHCKTIGDRIKLLALKYIQFPVFISLYDRNDSRITLFYRKLYLHAPKIQLLTGIKSLFNTDKTPISIQDLF